MGKLVALTEALPIGSDDPENGQVIDLIFGQSSNASAEQRENIIGILAVGDLGLNGCRDGQFQSKLVVWFEQNFITCMIKINKHQNKPEFEQICLWWLNFAARRYFCFHCLLLLFLLCFYYNTFLLLL